METKIAVLIAKLERSRQRLDAAMLKIAPQDEIYPSWKLKQVMDHITGWDELVATTLRAYQRGETPDRSVETIDRYNDGSVVARQGLSLEQSRQAFDAARQEVLDILSSLPEDMLVRRFKAPWGGDCTVASVVKIFASHEQEHARQIEEKLGS